MIVGRKSPRIVAAVLAAGCSSRFGATKQLLRIDGEAMVRRATRLALAVCPEHCLLVVGHDGDAVAAAAECEAVVRNNDYAKGMSSSLQVAAKAAADADAMLVVLADQPRVTAEHLASLLQCWSGNPAEIVATDYGHAVGAPALLPAGAFAAIAQLGGDQGARSLFYDPRFSLKTVTSKVAAIDIDTPADLDALRYPAD